VGGWAGGSVEGWAGGRVGEKRREGERKRERDWESESARERERGGRTRGEGGERGECGESGSGRARARAAERERRRDERGGERVEERTGRTEREWDWEGRRETEREIRVGARGEGGPGGCRLVLAGAKKSQKGHVRQIQGKKGNCCPISFFTITTPAPTPIYAPLPLLLVASEPALTYVPASAPEPATI
jgi:hypothetical protein